MSLSKIRSVEKEFIVFLFLFFSGVHRQVQVYPENHGRRWIWSLWMHLLSWTCNEKTDQSGKDNMRIFGRVVIQTLLQLLQICNYWCFDTAYSVVCTVRDCVSDFLMSFWIVNTNYSFLFVSQSCILTALAVFLLKCFFVTLVYIKTKKLPHKLFEFEVVIHMWSCMYSYGKITMSKFLRQNFKKFWSWESSDFEFEFYFLLCRCYGWANSSKLFCIAVTVTCTIAMVLCFCMELSSLSIEEKQHTIFFSK